MDDDIYAYDGSVADLWPGARCTGEVYCYTGDLPAPTKSVLSLNPSKPLFAAYAEGMLPKDHAKRLFEAAEMLVHNKAAVEVLAHAIRAGLSGATGLASSRNLYTKTRVPCEMGEVRQAFRDNAHLRDATAQPSWHPQSTAVLTEAFVQRGAGRDLEAERAARRAQPLVLPARIPLGTGAEGPNASAPSEGVVIQPDSIDGVPVSEIQAGQSALARTLQDFLPPGSMPPAAAGSGLHGLARNTRTGELRVFQSSAAREMSSELGLDDDDLPDGEQPPATPPVETS